MKKNWWNSLRTKIIAWSFVPTVIILSAVAWFTFYSYQKVIGDLAIKQDQEIVQEKAAQAMTALVNLLNPILNPILLEIDIRRGNYARIGSIDLCGTQSLILLLLEEA